MIKVRCNHPGCNTLIPKGDGGYCDKHQPAEPKFNENKRRYGRKSYKISRDQILTKMPWCQRCWMEGILTRGTADHIVSMAEGGDDSVQNMQVLCTKHNSEKGNKSYKLPTYDMKIHRPGEHF